MRAIIVPSLISYYYHGKIRDLERRNGFTLRYFTEFGSFRAHCVKVVDKAITMDNVRLHV